MARPTRLFLALLPLVVSLLVLALPGRAQQAVSSRYAFADTTLLRDTLGLDFRRLFPVADSLQVTPDTLRAHMIRFRMSMAQLVYLADSLGMPVDSVGRVMERERFSPLAAVDRHIRRSDFSYSTSYDIQRTTTIWSNNSIYNAQRGPHYLNQVTTIGLQRLTNAGKVTPHQTRQSTTELGSRFSKNFSLGGQADLYRLNTRDPGSPTGHSESKDELTFTLHSKQAPSKHVSSELNFRSGYLNDEKVGTELKRGVLGDLNGRVRLTRGQWLSNDLSAQVNGNLSRTRRPEALATLNARDQSTIARGSLALFNSSPASLNLNYNTRRTLVEAPLDLVRLNRIRTANDGVDATLRLRRDNERFVNLTGSTARSHTQSGLRTDHGGKAVLRWGLGPWAIDANYGDTRTRSEVIRQRGGGGYIEKSTSRSAQGLVSRAFSPRITGKLTTDISLGQYRYVATADSATPPSIRDSYRQGYRIESIYSSRSRKLSGNLSLDVSLARGINLERRSSSSNSDTRSYRSTWIWNYQALSKLTATQSNSISADYQFFPFGADRNALSLSYNNDTRLSAIVTPRLTIDLRHLSSQQPRGSYTRLGDGNEYLKLSDNGQNFSLSTTISYRPSRALAISLTPDYAANSRSGTLNGVESKQREDRRLNFSGAVQVDQPIGRTGHLAGRIGRTYLDTRNTSWQAGVATLSPRSESDFWNGHLELTWRL